MSKKVNNWFNYQQGLGECNTSPSMAVPDQALSVKQIYERFVRGKEIQGYKQSWYDEENEAPDFAHMDLADQETYILEKREELRELKEKIKNRQEKEKYEATEKQKATRQAELQEISRQLKALDKGVHAVDQRTKDDSPKDIS